MVLILVLLLLMFLVLLVLLLVVLAVPPKRITLVLIHRAKLGNTAQLTSHEWPCSYQRLLERHHLQFP